MALTPEEEAATKEARSGNFEAGRYWSTYNTTIDTTDEIWSFLTGREPPSEPSNKVEVARMNAVLEMAKRGLFKLEKIVSGNLGRLTMLVIDLPAGLAGPQGQLLALSGGWVKSNAAVKKFDAAAVEPDMKKGDVVFDVADSITKGWASYVATPLKLITGLAVVGLIIYAASRLKNGNKS